MSDNIFYFYRLSTPHAAVAFVTILALWVAAGVGAFHSTFTP